MWTTRAVALALCLAAGGAGAAEGGLMVELNRLEPVESGCRAYLLVENGGEAVSRLDLDLVTFDPDGVIVSRLAVEAGPLRARRPTVKAFEVGGVPCDRIGRMLVNDVLACDAAEPGDCFARLETRARGAVDLMM